MNLRATGIVEIVVVLTAMVIGAGFVYEAYQLRGLTRPGEMRVWGGVEGGGNSTADSPGGSSTTVSSPTVAAPTAASTASPSNNGNVPTPSPGTGSATSPVSSGVAMGGNVEAGKAVFTKTCNGCHPGRSKGVGPALDADTLKQKYPQDSDLVKLVRGGRGVMPVFTTSIVSDDDLQNIIAYLRTAP